MRGRRGLPADGRVEGGLRVAHAGCRERVRVPADAQGVRVEVADSLAEGEIDPSCLEMEIPERSILNFDAISTEMHELSAMGVRFAVDDFGTGYSSLQHLHRLPISAVKIDRSF